MIHVTDLCATIVRLADPAANAFPATWTRRSFSGVVKNPIVVRPPIKPPVIRPGGIPTPPPVIVPPILNIVRVFNFRGGTTNSGSGPPSATRPIN